MENVSQVLSYTLLIKIRKFRISQHKILKHVAPALKKLRVLKDPIIELYDLLVIMGLGGDFWMLLWKLLGFEGPLGQTHATNVSVS